jgi:hypothetical protein
MEKMNTKKGQFEVRKLNEKQFNKNNKVNS